MLNFFFITSNGKFTRIDIGNITHVVKIDDNVHLQTTVGAYTAIIPMQKLKVLLPNDQFAWINETTAVPRIISNSSR